MATALEHLQSIAGAAVFLQEHADRIEYLDLIDLREADHMLADLIDRL